MVYLMPGDRQPRQTIPDVGEVKLAKTFTSWLEPIVMMWRFSKSNGPTEGFHNKMEMMTRRAYGFRNFENYRLRVMTHCGWDGIINRV
jgi:transposase